MAAEQLAAAATTVVAFETGFLFVARALFNLVSLSCFTLLSAGTTGVCHHIC